jgi:hypothetical protein
MASVMLSSIGRACPVDSREAYSIFIESFFSVGISEPNLNHVQRAGLSAEGFRRQRQRHLLAGFESGRGVRPDNVCCCCAGKSNRDTCLRCRFGRQGSGKHEARWQERGRTCSE